MIDEWSGFADLLANLIEKYASELDVENLHVPAVSLEDQDSAAADKKECVFKPEAIWMANTAVLTVLYKYLTVN